MARDPSSDPDATRTHAGGAALLASGTRVAGRYRIEELVGAGAMGVVYRAHDERLGVDVALKVLHTELRVRPDAEARFVRELVLARQVSHRNVVRIHDLGEDGEVSFLSMDYVEGRSLEEILREDGPLAPGRAVAIAHQLAEGLAAAHREGVVHRDLKPANVLVDSSGRAYVTDFGVARSAASSALTRSGAVVGTPAYLSPEQARGEAVDGRSDLYSLGLILFEMLTGELPFSGETPVELLSQRLSAAPPSFARSATRVSPDLERLVERCLARSPEDRPADAEELAAALAELGPEGADDSGLPGRPAPLWRRLQAPRRPGALVAVAIVLAVVAALGVAFHRADREAPAPAAGPTHAVAVLPFADETGRPELSWTRTGLAEMLAAALAESPELRVVDSLRAERTARDLALPAGSLPDPDARQVAELLDADRLVVGSLRAAGDRLRLDARLLAPAVPGFAGDAVRAETGPGEDLFALVRSAADELLGLLTAGVEPTPRLPSAPATALAAYSRGLRALASGDPGAAVPELQAAVEEDPAFGAAWLRLAVAHQELGRLDEARDAALRAVDELADGPARLALEARARSAALTGRPGAAREAWGTLVARYPHDLEAVLALAEAHAAEGRFGEAQELLRELVRDAPHHPRAWYLLGKFAILEGESRRAADEYLVRALVIHNRLGDDRGRADVLNALGVAHEELGEEERARERYREAAELRREVGDRRGYAASLANLGTLELLAGASETGRRRLEEALAIRRELGDREGLAALENDFGVLEEERGNYREALAHYRESLGMRRELGDRRAIAESLNNVGFAYHLLGDYENAGVYWDQALDLYEESGNREGVVIATQSLALLDLVRGSWPAALERLLASLEGSRELGMRWAEAVAIGHLGRIAQLQGRYGAALDSYERALAQVEALGDPRGVAEFSLFQASALVEIGALQDAEDALERAGDQLGGMANREQEAELDRLRGELALARGRPEEARGALERALEAARASGAFLPTLAVRHSVARADLAAGRLEPAEATLRAVVEEAGKAGCTVVYLPAAADLAEARRRAGDPDGASDVARRALRRVAAAGSYAGAWRLHGVLAAIEETRGDRDAARRSLEAAAGELERLVQGLPEARRKPFEALPDVASVLSRKSEGSRKARGV